MTVIQGSFALYAFLSETARRYATERYHSVVQTNNRNANNNRMGKKAVKAFDYNKQFNKDFVKDFQNHEIPDAIQFGRVLKNMGFGKVEIVTTEWIGGKDITKIVIANIRGKFGGGARKGVPIQVGSIVAVAENDFAGCKFQVIGVFERSTIQAVQKIVDIDPRVLDISILDKDILLRREAVIDDGFEFDTEAEVAIDLI